MIRIGVRKWVGNEKDGYCIFKTKRIKQPWSGQVWRNGRVSAEVVGKTKKETLVRLKRHLK